MRRLCWCIPVCLTLGCSAVSESSAPLNVPPAEPVRAVAIDSSISSVRLASFELADPVAFLRTCIDRVEREVTGYRATLIKQERIAGKLGAEEEIAVHFRQQPFSVLMEWKRGHRLARKTLYVEGEHDDHIVVQLAGWRAIVGQVTCPVHDPDARATSRYPITEFGMLMGSRRTLASWEHAQRAGTLEVSLKGKKAIPELGNRLCWVYEREQEPGSDAEGIVHSTFYFDVETGLQLGTVLSGEHNQLIARYFFRDVELNPTFDESTFCRRRMKR